MVSVVSGTTGTSAGIVRQALEQDSVDFMPLRTTFEVSGGGDVVDAESQEQNFRLQMNSRMQAVESALFKLLDATTKE